MQAKICYEILIEYKNNSNFISMTFYEYLKDIIYHGSVIKK